MDATSGETRMLEFKHKCSPENPCGKINYDTIYIYGMETGECFKQVYKHINCIFCKPIILNSSIEETDEHEKLSSLC